jgi:2,4-dienoyl-CoA reductase-like NADH-dependent reductase (Old Yellow Enzyme family)
VEKFVSAGRRAYESGYDMVQMHAAHGYLLSNFLSPYTNLRADEYGGSTQNRARVLVEIYQQLREAVGKQFPILIKLQVQDFVDGGLLLEEGKEITRIVVKTGYDAIEPSGGLDETLLRKENRYPSADSPEYFMPMVDAIKPLLGRGTKLMAMGGIKDPVSADKILETNRADFISMSRPLIREPELPSRWKSGDVTPSKCISCNSCYMSLVTGGLACSIRQKEDRKRLRALQNAGNKL